MRKTFLMLALFTLPICSRGTIATQRGLHAAIVERKTIDPDVIRSTEYIEDQLNSLAEQLAQIKKTETDQSHSTL